MDLSIFTINHEHSYQGLVRVLYENFHFDNIKISSKSYKKTFDGKYLNFNDMIYSFKGRDDFILLLSKEHVWGDRIWAGYMFEKCNAVADPENQVASVSSKGTNGRRMVAISLHEVGHLFGLNHHDEKISGGYCPMRTNEGKFKDHRKFLTEFADQFCYSCQDKIQKYQIK